MKHIIISLLGMLSISISAQTFKGIIVDNKGNKVEYVSIGIVNGNIGTASNINGEFSITLPNKIDNRNICFSRLGYKTYEASVGDFKKNFNGRIVLELKDSDLPELKVAPQKHLKKYINTGGVSKSKLMFVFKRKFQELENDSMLLVTLNTLNSYIGNNIQENRKDGIKTSSIQNNEFSDSTDMGSVNYDIGTELGSIVNFNSWSMPISVDVAFNNCNVDRMLFRFNIYEIDENGNIGKLVNNKEVYLSISNLNHSRTYNINLRDQDLELKGNYFFCLEWIDHSAINLEFPRLHLASMPVFWGESYTRSSSHGSLYKFPHSFGMLIRIIYEK